LSSFCSRLRHPSAGTVQEPDGHCFTPFVILHGHHCRFRRMTFCVAFNPHPVVELQGQRRQKNRVLQGPKFQHGGFLHAAVSSPQRGHLDRDANGRDCRKKARQLFGAAQFAHSECLATGPSHVASRHFAGRVCALVQREDTPDAAKDARSQQVGCTRNAKSTKKGNHLKVQKLRGLAILGHGETTQASHRETVASHFLRVLP
jgi:hypothetical protein